MNLRFFVYPMVGGPASANYDTLVQAIEGADRPTPGAVIVQGARSEPSGPAPSDVAMASCKVDGQWTLSADGEEEPGTSRLVRSGHALIEERAPRAEVANDAA